MKKLFAILLISIFILTLGACGTEPATPSNATESASESTAGQSTAAEETTAAATTAAKETTAAATTAAKETTAATSTAADEAKDGWTKVGKTVTVADVEYTVSAIKNSDGADLFAPEDGNTYLLIDLNVKNKTAEEQPLSSIMMFDLKDGAGKTYSVSLGGLASLEGEKIEQIDGSVTAKAEKRGGIAYEIPKNAKGLTLTIKDVLGSGSKTIKLN